MLISDHRTSRRRILAAGGVLAAASCAPVLVRPRSKAPIVIDGQGVPGWEWATDQMPKLAACWFEQAHRSGLTAVATTMNEMDGNLDALPGTTKAVAVWQSIFASNAEIMLADAVAAIERARDTGRVARAPAGGPRACRPIK